MVRGVVELITEETISEVPEIPGVPKRPRKILIAILLVVIVGVASVSVFVWWYSQKAEEEEEPPTPSPQTIRVPTDYLTIQEAINAAKSGDTIVVRAGTYNENVVLNKSVSLIGESKHSTIIDGGNRDHVIHVKANNTVISNFTIQKSLKYTTHGIYLDCCDGATIQDCNVKYNTIGVYLFFSSNNTLTNNSMSYNEYGVSLYGVMMDHIYSRNNMLTKNNISNNGEGIILESSSNNRLRSNVIDRNSHGFGIKGATLEHFVHDIDTSNTIDGKPIYYWVNRINDQISLDAAYVALVNSYNITVKGLELKNNWQGIILVNTTISLITNNKIAGWTMADGIQLYWSSYNSVSGNNITNNQFGIYLYESSNNTISGNNITNNERGIVLYESSNNSISGNNVTNNKYYGIGLSESSNNNIYHNNFINNTQQVYNYDSINTWDDGYPSGGNYWSDYTGVDVKSGPNQDQPSSDDIGDTAYVIDANNQDNYPLMNPWT